MEKQFESLYERRQKKRIENGANFRLDTKTGDMIMIASLTNHARQRAKERGISTEDALKTYGVKSSKSVNAVTVTAYNPQRSKRQPMQKNTIPTLQSLPAGHCKESIQIPRECVGHVIGVKGATIKKLKAECQVDIVVSHSEISSSMKSIHFWGRPQGVQRAKVRVNEIVASGVGLKGQKKKLEHVAGSSRVPTDPSTLPAHESNHTADRRRPQRKMNDDDIKIAMKQQAKNNKKKKKQQANYDDAKKTKKQAKEKRAKKQTKWKKEEK